MLTCKLDGDLLAVTETLMSFTQTRVAYWYYDVSKWLRTLHGTKDERPSAPMSPQEIAWVSQHYLTKAREPQPAVQPLNPSYDPKAKSRSEKAAASMEADDYYAGHSREACAQEWRRRYEVLRAHGE